MEEILNLFLFNKIKFLILFLIASLSSFFISFYWNNFFSFGIDSVNGPQKIHNKVSIRMGGLIIYMNLLIASILFLHEAIMIFVFLICILPLFLASAFEDIFQNVSVKLRLICITISSLLLIFCTNTVLGSIDLNWLNFLFSLPGFAILFTVLGLTATSNAWNFIDGLNGLASGLALIILLSYLYLSSVNNNSQLLILISVVVLTLVPIFIINILYGNLFLGDTGAYTLGIIIGWAGVYLTSHNNLISPWSIFLLILYPALELIFSFFRRILNRKSPFLPDNMHLHSMLYFLLKNKLNFRWSNSLTGFFVLIFASIPVFLFFKTNEIFFINFQSNNLLYNFIYINLVLFKNFHI